jgi:2-methylcitrate dehydratase PrpD
MPPGVRHQAALCLLDTIGCMIAGSATQEARQVLAAETALGTGNSVVIGSHQRLPAAAARVNGYAGDIFEVNDLIGGHASIGVVSAALALAGETGGDLIDALVAGVEVTARLYNTFYPQLKSYEDCGMVSVGLPSSVGAATAAARLLRLSQPETANALAMAAALAGWCPAEMIFGEGGTVKPMLFGAWPAATGLAAAGYARAGLSGPKHILESRIGYFATIAKGHDPAAITSPAWALAKPRRKLHACCGYIHSALDAIIALRKAEPEAVRDAVAIEIELPAYIIPAVVKSRMPVSPHDARFHLGFCVAVAAAGADAIVPEHTEQFATAMDDPQVLTSMRAIRVIPLDRFNHYHQSLVTVTAGNGRTWRSEILAPRGSPANPMSETEIIAKFDALAAPVIGPAAAGIRDAILQLEDVGELAALLDRLGG